MRGLTTFVALMVMAGFLSGCGPGEETRSSTTSATSPVSGSSEPSTYVADTTTSHQIEAPSSTTVADTTTPQHQTEAPSSTTMSDPFTKTVTFTTSDGVQLAGALFGNGDVAVVLAHQGTPGANQTTWYGFGELLAERGYTALAFDFRGIGESGGTPDRSKLDTDLLSALQFLRDEGHEEILCFGASMGGTTCIQVALNGYELAGLVALGSALITGYGPNDLEVSEDDLASLTLPKAFIAAENDTQLVVGDITRMYEASPEPKALYLLPGSAHGTDLFNTDAGNELTTILLGFLEDVVDLPPDPGESGSESPQEP
jgi:uncharacterized protein